MESAMKERQNPKVNDLAYTVTFGDFEMLQKYMMRRLMGRNRRAFIVAFIGVVVCAVLIAVAIIVNVAPRRASALLTEIIPYPSSFFVLLIICLLGAIVSLLPAIDLRRKMLRLQVSDDGPLLGQTKLSIEEDSLVIDRPMVKSKYLWSAFQGVEIAKGAIILPIDNGIGLVVPSEAFASEAERFAFAAEISKRMQKPEPMAA
ncbi:MAG TPA: YcxB family protein [Bauldia sp.]|nr:YcxB family protein [Bauldia sp.]